MCLSFGDDRYYEFMCFDVPKVVRSPVYDHGHDEESLNGRDVKIDILDEYIWTSERFRVIRVFLDVPGSYGNTRKKQWALVERGEKGEEVARASPLPKPNWTRGGGAAFLSLSLSLSFLPPSSFLVGLGKDESYSY